MSRTEDRGYTGEEREERYVRRENGTEPPQKRGTSWISVVIGFLTVLGAGVILAGIVGGVVGAVWGVGGDSAAPEGGVVALAGLLLTLLLSYLIGGYAAGRAASRSGVRHGLLVPVLSFALLLIASLVGMIAGLGFLDGVGRAAIPSLPQQDLGYESVSSFLSVSGVLALLFIFGGAAVGGLWGARTGSRRGSST
ncbi:hypothetical protein [Rubrobacter xylanophilus]|uniref:hypothetical protein n=1 Tax=Rubrobacter xylanophilus TaxID=49319 RepID=UPI001C63E83D|nr:hypothetical protein [Rubrobacter xylanophilus]